MPRILVLFLAALGLAGCVTQSDVQRGAVGAGVGCVAGEILDDGQCVEGAVVGGATAVIGGRL